MAALLQEAETSLAKSENSERYLDFVTALNYCTQAEGESYIEVTFCAAFESTATGSRVFFLLTCLLIAKCLSADRDELVENLDETTVVESELSTSGCPLPKSSL